MQAMIGRHVKGLFNAKQFHKIGTWLLLAQVECERGGALRDQTKTAARETM